jgi:hypothetical protein
VVIITSTHFSLFFTSLTFVVTSVMFVFHSTRIDFE